MAIRPHVMAVMAVIIKTLDMKALGIFNVVRFQILCKYIIFILSQTINYLNLHECAINESVRPNMKKSFILLALSSLLIFTGCDFLRKIAGRPTSEMIENKRIEVLRIEEALQQARLDSLKRVEKAMRDSLAALDSIAALEGIRQNGGTILNPAKLGGLFTTKLESRYYIIIGSYRHRSNAETLLKTAAAAGYSPALISFRNGLIAVGLCPVNNLQNALEALKKVRTEPFCPKDVWILLNE